VTGALVVAGPELVGRAAEQDRLYEFAAALADGPRALLVRGEPGIGKTMLWRYGVERCRDAGFTVLVARPAEEDIPVALGGLVDLFEDDALDTGALRGLESPVARGRAVLAALRRLAEKRPTVVAIDDLQWLDSASARALAYALRHLEAESVGVLATARLGVEPDDRPAPVDSLPAGRSEVVELGPLSLRALRRMLEGTVAAISRPTLRRIHEVSGGNPLFALELARSFAGADRLSGASGALPLPDSLQAAIAERLETVPAGLMPLLETASALGPASTGELRAALPGVDVDASLALAREHELLVEEGFVVRFSHPLVSSVVYGRMGPLERRRLHGQLASRTADPDVRARHLALSAEEADAAVAMLLEDAAGRARSRGAFDVAAELGRHSVRLTPAEDGDDALRRSLTEIDDLARAGEVARAIELSERLIEALPSGSARAEALILHSDLEADDPAVGVDVLERALADAGEDDLLRARVLQELAFARFLGFGDLAGGLECAREALAIIEPTGDPPLRILAEACFAHLEAIAGRPRPDVMAAAVERHDDFAASPLSWRPRILLAKHLRWAGDLEAARALRDADDRSSENQRPYRLYEVALIECAAGNLSSAEEIVRRGLEAARDAGDGYGERSLLYPLGLVQAWLGRGTEARETVGELLERAVRLGERLDEIASRRVLGLLALSEGDLPGAARELATAARALRELGIGHPGFYPVLPDAVEALARTGDRTAAEALLERLEREAEAVGSAWAATSAERCRGLLFLTRGETEAAAPMLERAAARFDELGHRPDAARSRLALGQALLRGGQRRLAARALQDARGRFAGMGAALWEARAAEQLERAAPGRGAGELTAAERRIAELVRQGRKNREIAQELLVSVATVEAHLTRIYRKLEVRSRSDLARLVTDREGADPNG
jgi:DNA-binding CsgD family transcriptional regulator